MEREPHFHRNSENGITTSFELLYNIPQSYTTRLSLFHSFHSSLYGSWEKEMIEQFN